VPACCGRLRFHGTSKSSTLAIYKSARKSSTSPPSQIIHLKNPIFIVEHSLANKMGVRDPSQEAAGTPDPVEKGFATLNTLRYVPNTPLSERLGAEP
jgi:hypothetical protein